MTYKQLIETFEIVAKYDGGLEKDCLRMWAVHDEHGIEFGYDWNVSVEDIRKLAAMEWKLGCDAILTEEDNEKWKNYKDLTDEELVELFNEYKGISTWE